MDYTREQMQEFAALAAEEGDRFTLEYWSARSHGDSGEDALDHALNYV